MWPFLLAYELCSQFIINKDVTTNVVDNDSDGMLTTDLKSHPYPTPGGSELCLPAMTDSRLAHICRACQQSTQKWSQRPQAKKLNAKLCLIKS